jgi:hemerythrin-like domain-containing protein
MTSIRKYYERDQRRLIDLLRGVQDAKEIGPDRAHRAFSKFRAKLERHIACEEKVLFPRFDETNGLLKGGPTAVMRVEHRQIRRLLDEIGEKLLRGEMDTDAEQIVLLELLYAHQQQERAVVYPTMDKALNTTELRKLIRLKANR